MRRAVIPPTMVRAAQGLAFSPGVSAGGFVFVTGMTGSAADGTLPAAPDAQFEAAFDKIAEVLAATGSTLEDVVELTSFHIDIRRHFDAFERVVRHRFSSPGPAWTAVGVADLRRPGALVEIRAIARTGPRDAA